MTNVEDVDADQFTKALKALTKIGLPTDGQSGFLLAHYKAKKKTSTATKLAEMSGYKNHGGINLQYGKLAHQIADKIGVRFPKRSCYLRGAG
jgi:hypothetical protein